MKNITKKAYAKINLFLDVHSKYENGYHEVSTVMQTVSLCDSVSISLAEKGITLICDSQAIPTDNKNIAYRAAELYFLESGIDAGVVIKIDKKIPTEAGLGGGSADAAATLVGLNELFGFPITAQKLFELGASLGADVPFCMLRGCAYADGIGDKLHPISSMPDCYIVIARGGEGYSTPIAYRMLDEKYEDFADGKHQKRDAAAMKAALIEGDLNMISENIYNIFEEVVLPSRVIAAELIETLRESGALAAMMSGSGTAVFGIFYDEESARAAESAIRQKNYFAEVCRPLDKE